MSGTEDAPRIWGMPTVIDHNAPQGSPVFMVPDNFFDTRIKMHVLPDHDDLGNPRGNIQQLRTANVRIEFTDDHIIIHGLGVYPMPMERWRVRWMEAWVE